MTTNVFFLIVIFFSSAVFAQVERNQPIKNQESRTNLQINEAENKGAQPKESDFEKAYNQSYQNRNSRTFDVKSKNELQTLAAGKLVSSPKSAEANLAAFRVGQWDLLKASYLETAYKLDPRNAEVLKDFAIYNHLIQQDAKSRTALKTLVNGKVINKDVLDYSVNALLSCPQNATLIVHAREDVLPLLFAQKILQKRTDIKVLSLDWLNSPQFKVNLQAEGYKLPISSNVNVLYLMNFLDLNSSRNLCLSLTIPKSYLQMNISNLYLTGLIFRFRKDAIDASDINRGLYLEILKMTGIENKEHPVTKNYLPFLLQLQQENSSDMSFPNVQLSEQLIQLAQKWKLEPYVQIPLEK
jgi:hypothetical protein